MEKVQPDAKYDLVPKVAPFMDVHFLFALLDFIRDAKMYSDQEISQAKFELLKPTNMVDWAMEVLEQSVDSSENASAARKELEQQRGKVLDELSYFKDLCQPMLDLIENEEEINRLHIQNVFTLDNPVLEEEHSITVEVLESFYKYAKLKYECGNYEDTLTYLTSYIALMSSTGSNEQVHNALWGKLACEIALQMWSEAMADLLKLMNELENESFISPLEQLQQRTWLLHWSLFIFAWSEDHRDTVVDMMLHSRSVEAIQTNAPWLIRYVIVGVLIHKRRRQLTRELIKIMNQDQLAEYSDPIVEFFRSLMINVEFDAMDEKMKACKITLLSDFFLYEEIMPLFIEKARVVTFEIYCRIHKEIELNVLAKRLAMDKQETAEKWIVDVIREAGLDARIDSQKEIMMMNSSKSTIYEQMIKKTKDLSARTCHLAAILDRNGAEARSNENKSSATK